MTKKYVVYIATNLKTGQLYIGITDSLDRRMSTHKYAALQAGSTAHFHRAIRKYGWENFEFSAVNSFDSLAEVRRAEIDAIEMFSPRYNMTRGGEGQWGRIMTPEGKKKIAEKNKGNKYHLGKTHSAEAKQAMRQRALQPERLALWDQYAALGPQASAKKVICETTGEIYDSASAAALANSVCKSAIIELCNGQRGRKTVGKKVYKYLGAT